MEGPAAGLASMPPAHSPAPAVRGLLADMPSQCIPNGPLHGTEQGSPIGQRSASTLMRPTSLRARRCVHGTCSWPFTQLRCGESALHDRPLPPPSHSHRVWAPRLAAAERDLHPPTLHVVPSPHIILQVLGPPQQRGAAAQANADGAHQAGLAGACRQEQQGALGGQIKRKRGGQTLPRRLARPPTLGLNCCLTCWWLTIEASLQVAQSFPHGAAAKARSVAAAAGRCISRGQSAGCQLTVGSEHQVQLGPGLDHCVLVRLWAAQRV